jgi:threonine/homoserine/homoserine lactone efflux protein
MELLIASGVTFGLNASLLPGPLQTYLVQLTLSLGWRRSIVGVLAPLIADVPIIILTVFLLSHFPAEINRLLQIAGGVFLLWIAWNTGRRLRAGVIFGTGDGTLDLTRWQVLARMVGIILLSPGPYIFWSTVNGPLFVEGLHQSIWHAIAFLVAFYGTFLGMLTLFVFIFDHARQLDRRITQTILSVTLAALVFLGLRLIALGIGVIV